MMKTDHCFPPRRFLSGILAAGLVLPISGAFAQTYEYDWSKDDSGSQYWNNSVKWGLNPPDDPQYPSGVDVVAKILRLGGTSNQTLRLDNLNLTLGELRIGEGGDGSRLWGLNGSIGNVATITLSKSSGMGIISTNGATTTLGSSLTILATGGVEFQGNSTLLIAGGGTKITGGVKHSGGGGVYLYRGSMIADQEVELAGGNMVLGTSSQTYNTFNSNFTLTGTVATFRGIYSNTFGTTLRLTGNITGDTSLRIGVDNYANGDVTELTGNNNYAGSTDIRTNVLFHSVANFGLGGITFSTTARTLTHAEGNTADITTNSNNAVRTVDLGVNTTIDTGANDVVYANAVTGAGRLIKEGEGSLRLDGANSFAGTTVAEGKVIAGSSVALGLTTADLEIGADGALEILDGLTVTVGNLELESGAILGFHLGEIGSQLLVSGDQIGDGTFTISIAPGLGFAQGAYTLLSMTGSAQAGLSAFVLDAASLDHGTLEWDQGNGELIFHAIPEPSTAAFVLLGGIGAFAGLRRRRTSCAGR